MCKEIWRRGTEFLNQARQEARKFITKTLGFLFNDLGGAEWEYKVPRQCYGRLEDIPTARVYIGENLEMTREAIAANKASMEQLFAMFPQMVVHCQYDTEVYESEKARDSKSGTVQRIRIARKICILDVAQLFTMHYFRVENKEEYLRLVEESLKIVYLVACSISKMLEQCSDDIKANGTADKSLKEKYPISLLVDHEAARLELIEKSVLCITRRLYEQITGETPAQEQSDRRPELSENGQLSNDVVNVELV